MSSSWELVKRLLWLPFDIMQWLARPIIYLGRSLYGRFRPSPALKPCSPSPPPSPSCLKPFPDPEKSASFLSSSELLDLSSTAAYSTLPSLTIEMSEISAEALTEAEVVADLEAQPIIVEKSEPAAVVDVQPIIAENSELADIQVQPIIAENSEEREREPELDVVAEPIDLSNANADAVQSEFHENVAVVESSIVTHDISRESTNDRKKRPRDKKRMKVTKPKLATAIPEQDNGNLPSQSKKAKWSEDAEQSVSTTSCDNSASGTLNAKKKRPRKRNKKEEHAEGESGRMARPPPPNFFIAVQVSDKDIISKVGDLQKSLSEKTVSPPFHGLSKTTIFKDAMVPLKKLHFTLHVMHLKGKEDVEKAQTVFSECCKKINDEFIENPLDLNIEGVGHFKNSVIFAQIKDETQVSRLTQLANRFREIFDEINVPGDPRPFKPHMTIGKISRSNKLHKLKIRSFPPDILSDHLTSSFGTQRVTGIQMLYMAGEDKLTGYYRSLGQYDFHPEQSSIKPPKVDELA